MAPGCSSPIRRFTHEFTTLIVISLVPGLRPDVTSIRYGACQVCPNSFPLTDTTARFLTSPKSIHNLAPLLNQEGAAWRVFVYVPIPEKYFTPGFSLRLQSESSSSVMESGAPRPGWNVTFHGPLMVVTFVVVLVGIAREVSDVGLRNTTKTVPQGSSCSGTVVRPSATLKDTGSEVPVSARHNSGCLPATRNEASIDLS